MGQFIIKIFLLSFALGLGLSGCSTVGHKGHELVKRDPASHSWGTYHWARATPQFTLKLGDNLTTSFWRAHLAQGRSRQRRWCYAAL